MGAAADTRPPRGGTVPTVQLRVVRSTPASNDDGSRDAQAAGPDHELVATLRTRRGLADLPTAFSREDQVADLFRQHAPGLTRLAGLLTSDRSAAEEVVQDAFVGLHRRFGDLRDHELALAYLRASVVNGSRSKLRRRRTERAHVLPYLPPAPSAEDGAMARDELQRVRAALTTLPRRQREVVVLRYHMDLSEAEIADSLGISRGAVKAYASRALHSLGAALKEQS